MTSCPIGPAPVTSTRAPIRLPARCAACSATESGSAKAISSKGSASDTGKHWVSRTVVNSEKPPCMCGNLLAEPMKNTFSHRFGRPSRQRAQWPQLRPGLTQTRWPGRTRVTSAPTSATSPANSWPGTIGISSAFGVAAAASASACRRCRSLPQMPVACGAISS